MSFQASEWARKQQVKKSGQKLLLMVLASYSDADGYCFPGQKRLAFDCCMTVRAVQNNLKRLVDGGHIEREKRRRADGSRGSDLYYLRGVDNDKQQGEESSPSKAKKTTTQGEDSSGLEPVTKYSSPIGDAAGVSVKRHSLKWLWDSVPEKLADSGVDRKRAKSWLGSMLKRQHQPHEINRVVDLAISQCAEDVISYSTAILKKSKQPNKANCHRSASRSAGDDGAYLIIKGTQQWDAWYPNLSSVQKRLIARDLRDEMTVVSEWPAGHKNSPGAPP